MSRLKELRVHGFKSFADPTRFVFEPGVNAVIGPNGSGKSNMADAVRWVLGEQSNRSLRTRRADDVIFAGSDQRRAQGMAEAILTLDNADGWLPIDYAEVSVGRRTYRSGEGEYLVNGAKARLRDVVDLLGQGRLGANELVVVGQGTVDAALSLRPDERRQLFEEAAGVKSLQVKRNEASVRLGRALDNLTRVSDLVGELKPQVRRLALQAEHQQQHDTLGARARALVVASHRRREQAARAALGEARRAAAAAEAALAAFRADEEQERSALAAAEARYWDAEEAARAAAATRATTHEALVRAESRLEALVIRERELTASVDANRAELQQARAALDADADPAYARIAPALVEAADAERAWREAVDALGKGDGQLLAAEEALAEARAAASHEIAERSRVTERAAHRAARRDQLAREAREATAALEAARTALAGAVQEQREAEAAAHGVAEELEARAAERDATQSSADGSRQRVMELSERLRLARAELDALASAADPLTRLSGRLASAGWTALLDVMAAPEATWAAIEAVLGSALDGVLLWRDGDPVGAVEGARGTARLVATTDERTDEPERTRALAAVAAERTLAEWVGGSVTPIALRRAVVAPDVGSLLSGWRILPRGWCAVTVDGDLADARGVILLRGRAEPPGGASAREHARRGELSTLVASLDRELGAANRAAHEAAEGLRRARERHLATRERHDQAEREVRRARGEAESLADRVRATQSALDRVSNQIETLPPPPETPMLPAEVDRLQALQAAADSARARRDELAAQRDAARQRWVAARESAEAAEKLAASEHQERAMLEMRAAQLEAGLPERMGALGALAADRASLETTVSEARRADSRAAALLAAADEARAAARARLRDMERGRGGGQARLGHLEREAQATAVDASRRDEALTALARERDLALEGLPDLGPVEPDPGLDQLHPDALEAELRRVRRTLGQIGSVNPFAIEEHRALAERLDEMTSQETDLRSAISGTEDLIARLDAEISEKFQAAFRAIGQRFDEFCRLLFAGGSGSLQMVDDAEADAPGGIEIAVRPPGKRLQRLAMLSGGERALTGVALLFAMLTVNPVPFCILDEVDAALDEANIGRFADALRRLSGSIDFVVITHNRATIEVADTIYGVTMTDAAVSRVLSLRLADVPVEVVAS